MRAARVCPDRFFKKKMSIYRVTDVKNVPTRFRIRGNIADSYAEASAADLLGKIAAQKKGAKMTGAPVTVDYRGCKRH
jgi:hypothetical protein